MSMLPYLRAAVRPALRRSTPAQPGYDTTRDPSASSAVVDCAVYRDGRRALGSACLTPREAMARVREGGGFAWIGLHEPTEAEFAGIAATFGLHPLAVEDAVHAHQRPKLERYDDTLFTVFKTIHYVEHAELTATSEVVETGEVMCFTGPDFVITVRHGGQGSLKGLRHRLQDDPGLLAKGPPRSCTPSPTTSSTGTSRSRRPSRTTSTRWRARCSPRPPRAVRAAATRAVSTSSSARCWSSSGPSPRCCGRWSC